MLSSKVYLKMVYGGYKIQVLSVLFGALAGVQMLDYLLLVVRNCKKRF